MAAAVQSKELVDSLRRAARQQITSERAIRVVLPTHVQYYSFVPWSVGLPTHSHMPPPIASRDHAELPAAPQHIPDLTIEPLLAELERGFAFRDPPRVILFLAHHSQLVPILIEARRQIQQHLLQAKLALEVVHDRDRRDQRDVEMLVAFVGTTLEPDEAVARLDRFYRSWWLKVASLADDKLAFNLECL